MWLAILFFHNQSLAEFLHGNAQDGLHRQRPFVVEGRVVWCSMPHFIAGSQELTQGARESCWLGAGTTGLLRRIMCLSTDHQDL